LTERTLHVAERTPRTAIQKIAPCAVCGYDLHGLPLDGRCPECGAIARRSLRRELIRFSHPGWVAGLDTGAALLLQAPFVGLATVLLLAAAEAFQWIEWGIATALCAVGFVLSGSAAASMFIAGALMLSRPDPRELPETRRGWLRPVFRWGWLPAWVWFLYRMATEGELPRVNSGAFVTGVSATAAWLAVLILHMSRLAELLASQSLRRTSRWCLAVLAMAVASALWLPLHMLSHGTSAVGQTIVCRVHPTPANPSGWPVTLIQVWELTLATTFIAFVPFMLALFGRCRSIFRQAVDDARQNWSRPVTRVELTRTPPAGQYNAP
jgi:hypothetical protein